MNDASVWGLMEISFTNDVNDVGCNRWFFCHKYSFSQTLFELDQTKATSCASNAEYFPAQR